ncbi:hypothetical protein GE061_012145 [Apolygus lucorum]|uniref:CUB domain-containing protein n=1 Tax=Apolygus lucorum TaxID=248454 RepID=A0A8S9XRD8_APOLU|nr:hypothetical protein GE061_012145 [Apolygus lucorum]
MPVSTFCTNGYIEIFENSTDTSKAHKLGETYCGGKQPPAMTSSSNVLMIVLTTPTYSNFMARFIAYYRIRNVDEGCSANFFSLNGAIQSPQYPKNYPNGHNCVWTITVPAGKQISLHFTDFELEGEAPCKSDFLEIRNGGGANSPLIGKYCGAIIGDEITSFGNQLYIRFFSDSAISFKGFSLTWDGTLSGCGGDLNGYSGSIISPNYPYPYARRGRCTWRISVSQGSVVALSIVDIDLETSPTCSLDFIEIRDGSTSRSPLLGKYCASDHPITIASTSNAMRIYFQSDISKEGRGFHLKFSTVCNRTIKGYRGVIESPEFPMALTQPLDCTWTIEAPMGNAFTVVFSHLMFVKDKLLASICPSSSPICEGYTNCNSNALQISEGPSTNGKMLGTYCGSQSLMPTINSTFNQVHVHLKVTGFRSEVLFRLEWFVFGCGGILKGKSYGELSTPDYPDLISRPLVCEWTIIADLGNSIKFSVVDLAIDKPNDCDQNFLEFFGGPDSTSPLRNKFCHSSADGSSVDVQTSGNRAFVRLQVNQALKHFRFKANYEEIHSSCGGFFSVQEGSFHSKNYPQNYDSFDDCAYTIMIAENHRINLTFVDFDLYNRFTSNCSYSYVKVYDGQINDNSTLIRTLCGSKIPQSIISTSNVLNIRFNAGERVAKGFLAKYAPICGTNINVTDDGVLSHTEYYTTRSYHNCTWVLRTDKLGKKLTLTFTHLEIRRSAASKSSVGNNQGLTIYAGLDESILLLNLTDDVSPPALVVPGGVATVKLVTSPDLHVSFNLHYSTYDNVCGGTFEADRGQFASPNYPDNYPPNVECVWDIINTPGNTLVLQFEELKIQSSDSCNDNYVEVRAKDQSGTLIGFKASFYIAPFTVTGKPEGDLQSPRYPMASIRKSDYKWRITTTSSSRIDISFNEIYFEGSTTCVDKLTLFDGYDETGKILKEFCGLGDTTDLEKVQTTSNAVFIVFHSPAYPARFSISWKQVHRTPKIAGVNSSVNCTHRLQIPRILK